MNHQTEPKPDTRAAAADPRTMLGHVSQVAAELKAIQTEIASLRAAQDADGGLEALTRQVAAMGKDNGVTDAERIEQLLRKRASATTRGSPRRKSRLDQRGAPNGQPPEHTSETLARWCSPWEIAVFVFLVVFLLWQLLYLWQDEELWDSNDHDDDYYSTYDD